METYEQKVERVAIALWVAISPHVRNPSGWKKLPSPWRYNYIRAAKAALVEEAREIEDEEAYEEVI